MDWLKEFNIYTQGLILSAIIVGVLTLTVTILYLFNIKIPKQRLKYVYAFSSGFLIITAIVGQWVTARHSLQEHWVSYNLNSGVAGDGDPTFSQSSISIVIIAFGAIAGTLLAYGMKKLSVHDHSHNETVHKNHNHSTKIINAFEREEEIFHEAKVHKEKAPIVYMILTHRVPAGLLLGILLVNFNNGGEYSFAALLVFVLHTIPDMIIIYYSRIEAGYSRKSSFIFSIFAKLILIPFIIMGIAISTHIDTDAPATFWIIPFLLAVAGLTMVWGALFELAPSFIRLENSKETYKLIFTFVIGLIVSMSIQLVHYH